MSDQTISISGVIADNNTQRLNYIPGRTLSEQEFDLMQVYVDERCEDLLLEQKLGILQGLDLILPEVEKPDQTLSEILSTKAIQINAGIGISYSGKVITNRLPIRFYWQDLLNQYLAEQTLLNSIDDGIYFVTLRRTILIFEEAQREDPNTRTELNPLRDTRLETLAQVSLQPIWVDSDLFQQSRQRIGVAILQRMLEMESFSDNPDQIKLALVKIVGETPEWIDTLAGRFLARENPVQFNLMDYWHSIVSAKKLFRLDGDAAVIDSSKSLQDLLDINCLPSAGKFPAQFIDKLAGEEVIKTVNGKKLNQWARPELKFKPDGLQIEIVPIPENTVQGILQNELNRGVIDLHQGSVDRFRIMVAVYQNDYHPKLMDLPEIDIQLINNYLIPKQNEAVIAHENWEKAYMGLYGGLKNDIKLSDAEDNKEEKKKTLENFASIYFTDISKNSFSGISDEHKTLLRIPKNAAPEPSLIHEALRSLAKDKVSRPYTLVEQIIKDNELPTGNALDSVVDVIGKISERLDTQEDIEMLEALLLKTNQLIDEVRDYLSLQRQQLDSITVGFSSIAGGVPGDGTGLKLMRWSEKLTLTNKLIAPIGG